MNLTILSLISASLTSNSPAFVGKSIKASDCTFRKFFSLVFYNQQSFYIKRTKFQYGLGGVIKKEQSINSEIINDEKYGAYQSVIYENELFSKPNEFKKDSSVSKASFSVEDCTFKDITFNEYIIKINTGISFYLTDSTFCKSTGSKNPIWLELNRCNTITHVCCNEVVTNNAGGSASSFIYSKAQQTDFFILVYSTIVGKIDGNQKGHTVYSNGGQHYHRCDNYTNHEERMGALGMDASRCFSCGMLTLNNINGPLFKVSGSLTQFDTKTDKKHIIYEMISAVGLHDKGDYNGLIRIEIKEDSDFEIYFNNCVFNDVTFWDPKLFSISNDIGNVMIRFCLNNCAIDNRFQMFDYNGKENNVLIDDTSIYRTVGVDQITPLIIVHYTNAECHGLEVADNEALAKGCHVDRCYDGSNCNNTIGFPEDAAPYKTKFYADLQTPTPSPTSEFSNSKPFTESKIFSPSAKFTKSSSFTSSQSFTPSKDFTKSGTFTNSHSFTESHTFSPSNKFTESSKFTKSKEFTSSQIFTRSKSFTPSKKFSASSTFTKSNIFTESSKFTKSDVFSESLIFPHFHPPETTPPQTPFESLSPSHSPPSSESLTASKTASASKSQVHSIIPSETVFPTTTRSTSMFCPDNSSSSSKRNKCNLRLYMLYVLLAITSALIIVVVVLSVLLYKKKNRVQNFSSKEDDNETEPTMNETRTSDDPFFMGTEDESDHH